MRSFSVGEHVLPIVKSHRKKSIGFKPNAHCFELHVPGHLSDRALKKVLNNHSDWIQKRLQAFQTQQEQQATVFQFKINQPLMLLGDALAFVLTPSQTLKRISVSQQNKQLMVTLPDTLWPTTDANAEEDMQANLSFGQQLAPHLSQPLSHWYKEQAVTYFEQKMPFYAQQIGVEYTAIQVKGYKSRWGSCYPDGRIQFNWKLIQAPSWVVDYVMVHELCHLKQANHSAAFWNLVQTHYPQTPQAKKWLKAHQYALMAFLS